MKILRSMAVWIAGSGLLMGTVMLQAQQGTGQHNGGGDGMGGAMGGGMGASQGGASQTGASQGGASQAGSSSPSPGPRMSSIDGTSLDDVTGPRSPRTDEDLDKMRNVERQKKLLEDTNRLLALANELKADMDKTNKDTLSLDVVRKADEIEKLAHSVKERMKGD